MDRRIRYIWWGVLGVLLVAAGIKFFLPVKSPVQITESEVNREIVVYVTGAVNEPGLLRLPLDSRLDDALKLAGLTPEADLNALNPAQRLKDGQKIVIPSLPSPNELNENGDGVVLNQSPTQMQQSLQASQTLQTSSDSTNVVKININTAGINELDKIPGIGPTLAQRIIDYRQENGLFSSPEDIQNVSGIGAKTYEKMSDYISVWP